MNTTKNLKLSTWTQTRNIMEQCTYTSVREAANPKYFG